MDFQSKIEGRKNAIWNILWTAHRTKNWAGVGEQLDLQLDDLNRLYQEETDWWNDYNEPDLK